MHLGIEVIEAPLRGAEARLVRREGKGRIRVRNNIRETGRRRFVISHEIGHWCLHEASTQLETCLSEEIHGYVGSNEELESNAFAAELLMPKRLVRERYGQAERTLDLIGKAADEMLTTFTATAVRLVETSNDPYLVVFSRNGKVQWSQRSARLTKIWLQRKQHVDQDSTAWAAEKDAKTTIRPQRVRSEAWFGHLAQCERLEVYEQSMCLGRYGIVVTIISCFEHEDSW